MDEWERGALMFASVLVAAHDQPTMAADVLHELGLGNADCSGLEAYDKRNLRKLQGERGGLIQLRGLGGRKAPNVAGNRLARQGQSELTGLLGGPARSEKE